MTAFQVAINSSFIFVVKFLYISFSWRPDFVRDLSANNLVRLDVSLVCLGVQQRVINLYVQCSLLDLINPQTQFIYVSLEALIQRAGGNWSTRNRSEDRTRRKVRRFDVSALRYGVGHAQTIGQIGVDHFRLAIPQIGNDLGPHSSRVWGRKRGPICFKEGADLLVSGRRNVALNLHRAKLFNSLPVSFRFGRK